MMNAIPFYGQQQQQEIGQMNEAALMALAQQGNPQFTHAALLEQQAAQQQMQRVAMEKNIEVPKVNFYPSRHADPRKARKSDIKQAYKLLRPTKRSIVDPRRWLRLSPYRYAKDTGTCCIDGCNVKELIQYDNLYARICDEDTGKSLWELYWQNPITGEAEAFVAREGVTSGRSIRGTYCPEHLHLYHLLRKWEEQEEAEAEMKPSRFRDKMKKGVSLVSVPVATLAGTETGPQHPMVDKYEPFFAEIMADSRKSKGITVQFYANPETEENDLTVITFDNRMFQKELLDMKTPTQAFQEVLTQQMQQMQQTAPPPLVNQQPQVPTPLPNQTESAQQ
tara:strand:+ start:11456 stop:12463 length:1008 start_codon:yes stop_codon:yes gene_type:complete